MRKLATLSLVAVTVMALAMPAVAQPDPYDLGFFFDPAGTISEGTIGGFVPPVPLYFLMLNLQEQIVGYEVSVDISGTDADSWTVTRNAIQGLDVDNSPDGYVVGIGVCAGNIGGSFQITTYDFGYFLGPDSPDDTLVCVGPPTVSNPSIPGFASYQTCSGSLEATGFAQASTCIPDVPDGCAIINSVDPGCVIATEQASFGALKASY